MSQQLQFAMVSVDPAWNILTCASQNMDEEMSKLLAAKIIQTYTQLMKMQSETESQSSSSLSITVRRFFSFWTIPVKNWKLLLACALVRVSCVCSLKKIQWTRSGQAPLQVGFAPMYATILTKWTWKQAPACTYFKWYWKCCKINTELIFKNWRLLKCC